MSAARSIAVALVAAVVVVGSAAGAGLLGVGQQSTPEQSVEASAYSPDERVVIADEETGQIEVGGDESKVVLIDTVHGNDIGEDKLSAMVSALSAAGHEVRFTDRDARRGSEFNATLRQADVFVVISPERPFTQAQLNGVDAFTDAGGRLLLADDPQTPSFSFFGFPGDRGSSAPGMAALASQSGISFQDGYVYNTGTYDSNYRSVYATPGGGFASDVEQTTFRNTRAVTVRDGTRLLVTGEGAELSTTRDSGQYAVAVRSGNVVAVGSTSVFATDGYQNEANEEFTSALLTFLVTGDKRPSNAPAPSEDGRERTGGERPPRA
ncbi:hypothetical protein BRD04_09620 [Halobacteriales archaeon QS_9_67_17]|nr:MAG: hypothetical protein BRD04_09620 [Halobacteriales archaeon QS_9_67_17]